jgi:hypothetical protein
MKRFIGVCAAIIVALSCGCEKDSGGQPTLAPEQTGVVPELGSYKIRASGSVPFNGYKYQTAFKVTATNNISYTSDTFAYYDITVHDGGVSYSNGYYYWVLNGEKVNMQDEGNGCPTDGFAIYAKWTSPTHFEGTMWFGNSNNGLSFTADK